MSLELSLYGPCVWLACKQVVPQQCLYYTSNESCVYLRVANRSIMLQYWYTKLSILHIWESYCIMQGCQLGIKMSWHSQTMYDTYETNACRQTAVAWYFISKSMAYADVVSLGLSCLKDVENRWQKSWWLLHRDIRLKKGPWHNGIMAVRPRKMWCNGVLGQWRHIVMSSSETPDLWRHQGSARPVTSSLGKSQHRDVISDSWGIRIVTPSMTHEKPQGSPSGTPQTKLQGNLYGSPLNKPTIIIIPSVTP